MFIRKNIKRFVILFFIAHFVLQFVFLILGFGSTMALFDNPDNQFLDLRHKIYEFIFSVLNFPFVLDIFPWILSPVAIAQLPNVFEFSIFLFPFIANSLLWSTGFYFLLKKYIKSK